MSFAKLLGLAFVCLFSLFAREADAQWQRVNPIPTGDPITALSWDGSQFVGFDSSGNVLMSSDGFVWTTANTGRFELIDAIAHGAGRYVAVGVGFNGAAIITSVDGLTWTDQPQGVPAQNFSQVLWNEELSQFIAIADGGVILTSADGTQWSPQASGTINDLNDVAWVNHQYVAVGANGTILTSSNGIDWADHSLSSSNLPLTSITGNGTTYALIERGGTPLEQDIVAINSDVTHPDGWTISFAVVHSDGRTQLSRILWNGSSFVAIGGIVASSFDGLDWTVAAPGATDVLRPVAFNATTIVSADSRAEILVSANNGLSWTQASSNFLAENLTGIIWNGSEFIAVGDGGGVAASADGVQWQVNAAAMPFAARAVALSGNGFVAVGDGGIARSDDGFVWSPATGTGLSDVQFTAVTFGSGTFVAVGSILVGHPPLAQFLGVIYTSTDGTTWTQQISHAVNGDSIHSIVWTGDRFVAVGASSTHDNAGDLVLQAPPIFNSVDGVNWTRTVIPTLFGGTVLRSVAWNGHQFVAVGTPGLGFDPRSIVTSSDGAQWQFISLPDGVGGNEGPLNAVTWTGSKFVAVGESAEELFSPDGIQWTAGTTANNSLGSIAASGTTCAAVGDGAAISIEQHLCDADFIFTSGFEQNR